MKVTKVQNPKQEKQTVSGFVGGLNTFQDETLIKDSELTEAKNIILNVDGIEPRPGTALYGTSSGSRVLGLFPFYKSDGSRQFLRYASGANDKLQKYVSGAPTDIGSTTFTAGARMNFVQARDKVFLFNGQALSYYDGSTFTTYSTLSTPGAPTVTPTGGTSTSYSYRISAFNAAGETLAGTAGTTAAGPTNLSTTAYNSLSWSSVAGAVGYNIYGRKSGGINETYMATVYTTTYIDQGQDTPSFSLIVPEANTTTGVTCTMGVFGISRIFAAGDTTYPSRLYFSGVGDQITNFSASSIGGGFVDVFRNDGAVIRSILPYQGGIVIWKDNAIYKFSFTSAGEQQLEEITRSFGGISFRACKHVENDIIFPARKDGRLAFYSLGNQENYAASVLRTNELSIKVADRLEDVNLLYLEHSTAFYFNNIYGCAIPTADSSVNDRTWCLDTRFGSWVYWEGFTPNCFAVWNDGSGTEKLYYGDESSGYVRSMFESDRVDDTSAISVEFTTKAFNQKAFDVYKEYYYPALQFKDVTQSGAIEGEIYLDGNILSSDYSINTQSTGGTGLGAYLLGTFMLGAGAGSSPASTAGSDIPVKIMSISQARSIKFNFRSSSANLRYKFLSLSFTYMILEDRWLDQIYHSYTS